MSSRLILTGEKERIKIERDRIEGGKRKESAHGVFVLIFISKLNKTKKCAWLVCKQT